MPGNAHLLPRSRELLGSFAAAAEDSDVAPPLALAHDLARNHAEQWSAEDLCRSPTATDDMVGRVKRRIDLLNGRWVELVDQLDRWVTQNLRQDPTAVRHTETYGMLVDRLAIGWVREQKLSAGPESVACAARDQLAELAAAYDMLVEDVEEHRRSLPAWRSLKFYRTAAG